MRDNKLKIQINKPVHEIFVFVITPPNSVRWISSIISEETNEWPVKVGTIYKLTDRTGKIFEATVFAIENDKMVEWVSEDGNYHCKYLLKQLDKNTSKFEYYEWADSGKIKEPFTLEVLKKLKFILETSH